MRRALRRARERLARELGSPVSDVALFRRSDTGADALAAMGSAGMGWALTVGGVGDPRVMQNFVDVMDRVRCTSDDALMSLPDWVLVVVTAEEVRLFGSDRHARIGRQLACWRVGEFTATENRLPFEIDLWLRPSGGRRFALLKANRHPFFHAATRTARDVLRLARMRGRRERTPDEST